MRVTIVVPTLDPDRWAENIGLSTDCSGERCALNIVHDSKLDGFTKTVNRGLAAASTEYVCLLNDDAVPLTDGWLTRLIEAIQDNPRFGLAGPSGPCRTPPQNSGLPGAPYGIKSVSHLAFFCTVIKASTIEAIGLLDEDFIHYGSDVWYCWTADAVDIGRAWVRHVYVDHGVGRPIEPWYSQDNATLKRKLRERKVNWEGP